MLALVDTGQMGKTNSLCWKQTCMHKSNQCDGWLRHGMAHFSQTEREKLVKNVMKTAQTVCYDW